MYLNNVMNAIHILCLNQFNVFVYYIYIYIYTYTTAHNLRIIILFINNDNFFLYMCIYYLIDFQILCILKYLLLTQCFTIE